MAKQPGLIVDYFPMDKNSLRPHMRDATPEKGVLSHIKPVAMVHDMGAPRDELTYWRGTPSPSSAEFRAGVPRGINPSAKPEEESLRIHAGITASERSKKTSEK